jgi:hypothetical protein
VETVRGAGPAVCAWLGCRFASRKAHELPVDGTPDEALLHLDWLSDLDESYNASSMPPTHDDVDIACRRPSVERESPAAFDAPIRDMRKKIPLQAVSPTRARSVTTDSLVSLSHGGGDGRVFKPNSQATSAYKRASARPGANSAFAAMLSNHTSAG